jgi:hypothetical protein
MCKKLTVYLGVAGSGKDYEANQLENTVKIPFAQYLHNWAWKLMGYKPPTEQSYEWFKQQYMLIPNHILGLEDLKVGTGRNLLQQLGDLVRSLDSRVIVKEWQKEVLGAGEDVACTDCRFPAEVRAAMELEDQGIEITFIHCSYPSDKAKRALLDDHISEEFAKFLRTLKLKHLQPISCKQMVEYLHKYESSNLN